MNILVTGATGFIGTHFLKTAEKELSEGDELILLTSRKIKGYRCILHKNYTYATSDFQKCGVDRIDKVIHIGHYLAENHKEGEEARGNLSSVNNTRYLLDHLPNIPDIFVYCSTMAVYGTHRDEPIDESSDLRPDTVYAVSKILTEMLLKEWADHYGVLLHVLRLAHVYGPWDKREYSIPIWLRAARDRKAISLSANPAMMRNCVYVGDCCRWMLRALYLTQEIEIINLASERNVSMLQIAKICKEISNNPFDIDIRKGTVDSSKTGICFKNNDVCINYLGREWITLEEGLKKEYLYLVSDSFEQK